MRVLDLYWMENDDWWHFNENLAMILNDDAPEEAQKSYKNYLKQQSMPAIQRKKKKGKRKR